MAHLRYRETKTKGRIAYLVFNGRWYRMGPSISPAQDKRDAAKLERAFILQEAQGKAGLTSAEPSSVPSLGEASAKFLAYQERHAAQNTYARALTSAIVTSRFFGEKVSLTKVADRTSEFVEYRKTQGRANRTINIDLLFLSALYRFVRKQLKKWAPKGPELLTQKQSRGIRWFKPVEMARIMKAASGRTLAVILIAWKTGMRDAEIRNLFVDQIDWNRREIRLENRPDFQLKKLRQRTIPVDPVLWDLLVMLRHHVIVPAQGPRLAELVPRQPFHHYLLCHDDGGRIGSFRDGLRRVFLEAGVKGSIHAFRHTFATECLAEGMSLPELQRILGHNTYQITVDIYGHLDTEHLRNEMRRLGRFA